MSTIEERFALATNHLAREATYLAGVSGGRDSVVLLHLLQRANFRDVRVCHFDHRVRGSTSVRDLEFTRNLAELSQLRFINDNRQPEGAGGNSESELRSLRFAFFGRVAQEEAAAGVFLGHHADDMAETMLWNLLRGSGNRGLLGIRDTSQVAMAGRTLTLLRPMLDIWRNEIDEYVEKHDLKFVDDETNRSRAFARNRLRHDIIPWLEKRLGRNVRENLHRTAAILSEENRYLDEVSVVEDWAEPLPVAWLAERPVAVQRRIILRWLRHHQIEEAGFEEVEAIRSLLDVSVGPARINLPRDRQARRRSGKIFLAGQSD